jgi:hypothetical protein
MSGNRLLLSVAAIAFLLACLWSQAGAAANPGEEQDCDVTADYFLGAENYPETIRLHREVLRKHPENALAHYHLGFAEGMAGDRTQELNEYRRAAGLGLSSWTCSLTQGSRCSKMAASRRQQTRCGLPFGLARTVQSHTSISA